MQSRQCDLELPLRLRRARGLEQHAAKFLTLGFVPWITAVGKDRCRDGARKQRECKFQQFRFHDDLRRGWLGRLPDVFAFARFSPGVSSICRCR